MSSTATSTSTQTAPSKSSLSLPLIDISPFLKPSSTAEERASTAFLDLARTFFTTTPDAEKLLIKRREPGVGLGDGARGYQVKGENVTAGNRDWHEGIDWYRPISTSTTTSSNNDDDDEGSPEGFSADQLTPDASGTPMPKQHVRLPRAPPFDLLKGVNLWPSNPAAFRSVYERYVTQMHELGTVVLHALGQALQLKDAETFVKATRASFWVMRAIGYPPLDAAIAASGGVSCGAHTDYGCLTLLLADGSKGALQVQTKATSEHPDGEWISADPVEGAFVVNIGDMVELWTNGLYKSTRHRVVHRGGNYRVSVPFFLEPDLEARVGPLEECVERTGGVRVGREVRYGDHLAGKVGGNFYGGEKGA